MESSTSTQWWPGASGRRGPLTLLPVYRLTWGFNQRRLPFVIVVMEENPCMKSLSREALAVVVTFAEYIFDIASASGVEKRLAMLIEERGQEPFLR